MNELKYSEIINKMTLDQKASFLTGGSFWETLEIKELGIPKIFLSDGPHGVRKQVEATDHFGMNSSVPATCFPTSATVANSWDVELGEELGKALGEESAKLGVNVLLGPGLNIKRNPLCGRNFEYFSEDPILAGKMAAAYVRGIQSNGISACLKHFACNNQETARMAMDSIVDERTMREIYLTAFEIAIKEGQAKCIMSAYNLVNGDYCNENKHLLVDILRDEWNYNGVVVTDWGANNNRVEGVKCFNSLEMPTTAGDTANDVIAAVKNGTLDIDVVDKNVDLLLNLVFSTCKINDLDDKKFDVDAHHKLAQKVAEESAVLLKNNGVLPVKSTEKLAFIGDFIFEPRYQGAGSSLVNCTKLEKMVDCLKAEENINVVGIEKGFDRFGKKNKKLAKAAIELASKADKVILFMGLDEASEAESLDRNNLKINENQIQLLYEIWKLNKKIIVVLSGGSPMELQFEDKVDGILHSYLSGQAGAKAILNILTGKVNPSGKLSETYPFVYEDVSSSHTFPSTKRTVEYREAYGIGYRYAEKANVKPRYPFGYGLSYTTFEYSNLVIDDDGVSFNVKNTGSIFGKEIAQLYVGLKNSKVIRPIKELKGFIKISLNPGEEKNIKIPFDDKTFRYFNTKTNKWEIEGGEYDIYVGSSSNNTPLTGTISKTGTTERIPYEITKLSSYKEGKVKFVSDDEFERLLRRKIPQSDLNFVNKRKTRIIVGYNTTVRELKYAKGFAGRFTYRLSVKLIRHYKRKNDMGKVITIAGGLFNQPMRGLSRLTGGMIHWDQLDALIEIFNGHFFKGLHHFIKRGKKYKKEKKAKK